MGIASKYDATFSARWMKRPATIILLMFFGCIMFSCISFYEEYDSSTFGRSNRPYADFKLRRMVKVSPEDQNVTIGIVSILDEGTSQEKYRTAMDSMKCYAHRYNYKYNVLSGVDYRRECPQKEGEGWCRDAWLTNGHWNPETDFMFHAWKEVNKLSPENKNVGVLSGPEFYPWFNALKTPLTKSQFFKRLMGIASKYDVTFSARWMKRPAALILLMFFGCILFHHISLYEEYVSSKVASNCLSTNFKVYQEVEMSPEDQNVTIGIVSILEERTTRENYRTAMDSMKCYAHRYNYKYIVLSGADYRGECPQKDITFQRHCIVAHLLETKELDWILFVDSDIGVVNEKKRLEGMIIPNKDIIFYNRFFNHEVMAGSFFARRSKTSIEFLRGWANYEFRLPNSFHGRDNGAIHMWLLEQIKPMKKCSYVCHSLWNASIDYATLSYFTVCCRELLKNSEIPYIAILDKGEGWARDGWLTNSHWNSSSDFMFHARKERDKKKYRANEIGELSGPEFFLWFDTLRSPLELQQCHNVSAGWDHDPALIVPHGDILRHLKNRRDIVCWEYQQMTAEIKKKYKIESRKGNVKEKMTKSSNDEQTDNWIC